MNEIKETYHFSALYVAIACGGYLLAFLVALSSRPFPGLLDPFVYINVIFVALLFIDLKFGTYCTLHEATVSRTSYFVLETRIGFRDIESISFEPTYNISETPRSLIITGNATAHRAVLGMTEMAYTRPILAKLVRRLIQRNPGIKIDDQTQALLAEHPQPAS